MRSGIPGRGNDQRGSGRPIGGPGPAGPRNRTGAVSGYGSQCLVSAVWVARFDSANNSTPWPKKGSRREAEGRDDPYHVFGLYAAVAVNANRRSGYLPQGASIGSRGRANAGTGRTPRRRAALGDVR